MIVFYYITKTENTEEWLIFLVLVDKKNQRVRLLIQKKNLLLPYVGRAVETKQNLYIGPQYRVKKPKTHTRKSKEEWMRHSAGR
jgi:hypothetical protein